MSKTDNLHDFLKDLADTIRQKTGVSESLNPQQFSDKIKQIRGSEEESVTEYYYEVLPNLSGDAVYVTLSAIPTPNYILTNSEYPELPPVIETSTASLEINDINDATFDLIKYLRFKDVETYTIIYNGSDREGFIIPANTGDLESRALYYARHYRGISEENVQEIMKDVSTYFKKITKEEYWQALKNLNS